MEKEEEYIFTPVQKANSILWFAESGSIESAQNLFCQHYGSNKQAFSMPSKQLIYEWYNNFRDTGFTDESTRRARQHNMLDESTDMNFCPVPYLSLIGKMEGDKTIPVQPGQKENTEPKIFHPYTMILTKKLYIEDAKERTMFAKKELEHLHNNLHLLDSIWFTGEATFHTNGYVEVHNMRYTDKNEAINPDGEEISSTDRVIVWAALNAAGLLGPYFFLGDVTSDSYDMMLREFFYDVRQRISVHENPIFMHDDAPAHRKLNIQDFLEHEVPHHWIGTGSNYAIWPHHSPDISPLNYFLWGFIKSHVYKTPLEPGDKNELKHRISVAFKKVHSKMLKEVVEDYKVRLEKLLETKSALIETSVNVRYNQHSLSTNINRSNNCFIDWQDVNTDNDEISLS